MRSRCLLLDDTCTGQRIMENDGEDLSRRPPGRTSGRARAAEQPSPPTQHQPVHFQPAVAPHYYQQHAGNFNDMEGYAVHRNFNIAVRAQFSDRTPPLHRRDGGVIAFATIAGQQGKTKSTVWWQCETGTSAGSCGRLAQCACEPSIQTTAPSYCAHARVLVRQ